MTSERLTYAEIERLAYRMFEFGKSGNTASAQCEMQALRIRMGWTGPGASIEPPSAPSAAGEPASDDVKRLRAAAERAVTPDLSRAELSKALHFLAMALKGKP